MHAPPDSLQVGNAAAARSFFNQSMMLKPSVLAARNLATFETTREGASAFYHRAWSLWEQMDARTDPVTFQLGADLAGEMCGWMQGNSRWSELTAFLATLGRDARTQPYLQKDKVLHATAALAVQESDHVKAISILRGHCFPTYGSQRTALIQLWYQANLLQVQYELIDRTHEPRPSLLGPSFS